MKGGTFKRWRLALVGVALLGMMGCRAKYGDLQREYQSLAQQYQELDKKYAAAVTTRDLEKAKELLDQLKTVQHRMEAIRGKMQKTLDRFNGQPESKKAEIKEIVQSGNVEYLKKHDLDKLGFGQSSNNTENLLINAVQSGNPKMVEYLVSQGASVNKWDPVQGTPLNAAIHLGDYRMAEILITNGANVNAQQPGVDPPIFLAAQEDNVKAIQFLLDHEANIRLKDWTGDTALHRAAERGGINAVKLLLDRGLDINSRGRQEMTPLHEAARAGRKEVVSFLIERGADQSLRTSWGKTANELMHE